MDRLGLVEVAHESCNPVNESFVLASQVKQVYYLPYPCKSDPNLNGWWVAYKVSPVVNLSIRSMDEYNDEDPPCIDTFQEDGLEGEFVIDIGIGLDNMTISDGFDEINDPNEISMLVKQRNVVIGENVPPIEEQVAYNPEYFVDFTYPDPDDF